MKKYLRINENHVLSDLESLMLQQYHEYVHHCPAKKISILYISNCSVDFLFQV